MLRYIRWAVTVLTIPPVLVVLEAIIQPHLQEAAADKQVHLAVTQVWLRISEFANNMVGRPEFWLAFGLVGGAAVALWMVEWWFKKEIH